MPTLDPSTEELLNQAQRGDGSAVEALFARNRDRLRCMVRLHLDARVAGRVDPSDVIQEALLEASQKLAEYLVKRPIPFYPWLRQLAWEKLVKLHEKNLRAGKRSVLREEGPVQQLPDDSALDLARRLAGAGSSPSRRMLQAEMAERVRAALARLPAWDREVLTLRYLEEMTTAEVAVVLGVSEAAVKMRHRRALDRLTPLLEDLNSGGLP
jgi:RNA polymerase sigma-70 factor (ECF subfamily)